MDDDRDFFRGEKAREEIAKKFSVVQIAHYINLSEKPVKSVFRDDLQEVFIIELIDKKEENSRQSYVVGSTVADSLFRFTGQKAIPLFHPFSSDTKKNPSSKKSLTEPEKTKSVKPRTPLNEELYQALNIVLSIYGYSRPDGLFARLLVEVRDQFPNHDVREFKIQNFDKALKKFNRTLYELIDDLRKRHPNLRSFSFPLMEQILGPGSALGKPLSHLKAHFNQHAQEKHD